MKETMRINILFAELAIIILYSVAFVIPDANEVLAVKNLYRIQQTAEEMGMEFDGDYTTEMKILNERFFAKILIMMIMIAVMGVSMYILEDKPEGRKKYG